MNKEKTPAVDIVLDRPRRLCFDYNALCEIQALGYRLQEVSVKELIGRAPMKTVRDLLWAALVWEDEELTRAQVGKMIPQLDGGVDAAMAKINEAFELAMKPDEDGRLPLTGRPPKPDSAAALSTSAE